MEEENFWITRTTSNFEWAAFFMVGYLISLSLSRLINVGNLTNRSQNSVVDVMIILQAGKAKNCLRLSSWTREFYSSKTYTPALRPREFPVKLLLVFRSHGKATGGSIWPLASICFQSYGAWSYSSSRPHDFIKAFTFTPSA